MSLRTPHAADSSATLQRRLRKDARKSLKTAIIGATVCCGFFSVSPGHAQEIVTTQHGGELFEKHCAVCHGAAAGGQNRDHPAGGWDKDNNRLAPALNGTGHAWHHSPSLIYKYIQEGSVDESSPMPAFGGQLSGNDIRSIIMYLQSLWPEKTLKQYRERFGDER